MEELGEKYAFLAGKKCGSRKVLRFIRSLLHALTVQSLPPRGAWIEITSMHPLDYPTLSLPPRGAWIEIAHGLRGNRRRRVAPPAGSVD